VHLFRTTLLCTFYGRQHYTALKSFEKVNPGINDLFLSQNIAQKLPEKKIPSTAANATNLS